MNRGLRIILLIIAIAIFNLQASCQQKDTSNVGSVKGVVKDTALNYYLQSATVAVYDASEHLIGYSLTNNYGDFIIKNLPVNQPLKLRVSFVGYKTFLYLFKIQRHNEVVNAGLIILNKNAGVLEEITIVPPPVRMNNDTLEFSASAFQLDKNAVAEDLLRMLPGVIVWGDGTITVNGREIHKLLVDGKPFFIDNAKSGNNKIAIQNIPKGAIDKVQVYQEYIDPNDPYDSVTSINLKLRRNMHFGTFGIVSAGIGTNQNDESVFNLNFFNPKNQLSVAAQSNNINKSGNDINTILQTNTFAGKGVRVQYQPDFSIPGVKTQHSGGILFTHDFIPDFSESEKNRLTINSFINNLSNTTKKQISISNFIDIDSILKQEITHSLLSDNTEFTVESRYEKLKDYQSVYAEGNYDYKMQDNKEFLNSQANAPDGSLLNYSNQQYNSSTIANKFFFKGGIDHHGFFKMNKPRLSKWKLEYSIASKVNNLNKDALITFTNPISTQSDQSFIRKYKNKLNDLVQSLTFNLGDFGEFLLRNSVRPSKFAIQFENNWQLINQDPKNFVSDFDTSGGTFLKNNTLSAIGSYSELKGISGFRIGRSSMDLLENRYSKELKFEFIPNLQFSRQKYVSPSHAYQNLNRIYYHFLPNATISYNNFQYGESLDRYQLNFVSAVDLPDREQLFELPDSSDLNFIKVGNQNLIPSKNYELSFNIRHSNLKKKNNFNYGIRVAAGLTDNYLADSIVITSDGRSYYYTTNLDGYKYFNFSANVNKAFLYNHNQFQLSAKADGLISRNPGYLSYEKVVNNPKRISHVFMQTDSLSASYTYKDLIAVSLSQHFSFYGNNSTESGYSSFKSIQSISSLGISLNPTGKLNINSNLSFNRTKSSGFNPIKTTILNASLSYRFLHGDNLELKVSGLDLLNQNKGILNYGNNYSFTQGTVNLLHQYFMVTLSFYPRKFGKKTRK